MKNNEKNSLPSKDPYWDEHEMRLQGITTSVGKWGNSYAIRIPAPFIKALNIIEGQPIELVLYEGHIDIRKKKHFRNLKERLEAFYGKPIEEILEMDVPDCPEYDWGEDVGSEIIE